MSDIKKALILITDLEIFLSRAEVPGEVRDRVRLLKLSVELLHDTKKKGLKMKDIDLDLVLEMPN